MCTAVLSAGLHTTHTHHTHHPHAQNGPVRPAVTIFCSSGAWCTVCGVTCFRHRSRMTSGVPVYAKRGGGCIVCADKKWHALFIVLWEVKNGITIIMESEHWEPRQLAESGGLHAARVADNAACPSCCDYVHYVPSPAGQLPVELHHSSASSVA